ncbi:alpha/beta hydrolase [Levilactobacillus bambusae]|uniref:alpha/beta hydrolase n=1 Tax=Levilactobacillus bambusae TaxID=2024736 RepID=UPI00140228DC|nr:alpha/beta hydrolase [Levilactobacillus bambusae]
MDLSLVELVLASGAASLIGHARARRQVTRWRKNRSQVSDQVPILFLHGLRGGAQTMTQMVQAVKKSWHEHVLVIHVNHAGKLKITGEWNPADAHPLVQINFGNNQARTTLQMVWLKKVLIYLRTQHGVQNYDAVGHSAGCVTLVDFAETYNDDRKLPSLRRLVTIAGPFNGVLGMNESYNTNQLDEMGCPVVIYPANFWFPSYASLLENQAAFPTNVDVLNIYGDIGDGSHSDKYISTASARSLRYLLGDQPQSYHEIRFRGDDAEHSELHDNHEVMRLVRQFLATPIAEAPQPEVEQAVEN